MKIHQLSTDDVLSSLHTGVDGLSRAEAARRLDEYGHNRVKAIRRESLALAFLRELSHFFAIILWVAAGLAFFAESRDPDQGMATLGYAIVAVILVNGLFSFWQHYRAERALEALTRLLPHYVKTQRQGVTSLIPASEVVPGDVVVLEEGDSVPADCRLLEAFALRVNNATVTGEALPKAREAQPCHDEDLLHARNVLLAGTSVVAGEGKAVVFATGTHTEFGKIAHLTQTARVSGSPLQREIVRLSRIVALLATALGVAFFFVGQRLGLSFWENFTFAIGIIVANVPEGLLPTVTLSLALATQRMAKRNALIRHLPAVETLGSATVICTDKTGTLTMNRMEAKLLYVNGELLTPAQARARPDLTNAHRTFFETAMLCHNLKDTLAHGKPDWFGDPMEIALTRMARFCLGEVIAFPKINEVPFDTDRKRLSTVHQTPQDLRLYCKGAVETVLPQCRTLQTADGPVPLDAASQRAYLDAQACMAARGLRVLAFAWRMLDAVHGGAAMEDNLVLAGLVGLEDPPRPEVPRAIAQCREAGVKVIMVTGDHPHTALSIAREIGLVQSATPRVVTGDQLRKLSETQLRLALDAPEILFARVAADQKMRIVVALKKKQQVVAVTGDGVNDAPALKQADIGIAMGLSGTDVAKEAADVVLLDDNFATIVAAIEEGRAVYANIRKFLTYVLTSNIPEVVPYLAFVLLKIPLPLTVIQILAVDLGTDMLPALGLGAEQPAPDTMQRPPRSRSERLIDGGLLARAYLFLGVCEAVTALAAFFFVLYAGGWQWGQPLAARDPLYLQATTATLGAIILCQVINVFMCKSPTASLFASGPWNNRILLVGVALEVLLLVTICYTPWGNRTLGTAPLTVDVWVYVLPFVGLMLMLEECRKWCVRRWARPAR
jgi:calcium-translocating P-type ATPase